MSVDKRKVTTDALDTLGTIIDDTAKRDAIHLAVEPVVAGEPLYAGQHIGLDENGQATTKAKNKLGIVDPFVSGPIPMGYKFWMVIYPRVITSLRHVWTHPTLGDEPEDKKKVESSVTLYEEPVNEESSQFPVYEVVEKREYSFNLSGNADTWEQTASKGWVTSYAYDHNMTYEDLMWAAKNYIEHGDYITGGAEMEGEFVSDEFWDHYEIITGEKVEGRGSFFSCSC